MSLFQTATRRKAKANLKEFPSVLAGASKARYKKARLKFKRKLGPAACQTVKSEKLTHHDFAIRINAT